jgi:2-dehydro-3-deoxygluconokinase
VSALPKNDIGDAAIQSLRTRNVDTSQILRTGDRIGIYYLESGAVSRGSKVIYDRANSSFASLKKGAIDWKTVLEGVTWFHWTGITPSVSEGAAAVCQEACEAASSMGITISTDLNFRNKLWKWGKSAGEVMEELVKHCDIILGNEEDADMVFGIKPEGVDVTSGHVEGAAYESVGKQLMQRFPKANKVIITLRGSISASHNSWSGVLWNGKLLEAPTYQITHIVDRVGGGDSFMGGLIYGLISYPDDDQKALNFAVAASCLKHTIKGDFNLVTVEEVEKLMKGDASGRVSR